MDEMRSRQEIVDAVGVVLLDSGELDIQMYILEVLLDIRELLMRIPIEPIEVNIKNDYR